MNKLRCAALLSGVMVLSGPVQAGPVVYSPEAAVKAARTLATSLMSGGAVREATICPGAPDGAPDGADLKTSRRCFVFARSERDGQYSLVRSYDGPAIKPAAGFWQNVGEGFARITKFAGEEVEQARQAVSPARRIQAMVADVTQEMAGEARPQWLRACRYQEMSDAGFVKPALCQRMTFYETGAGWTSVGDLFWAAAPRPVDGPMQRAMRQGVILFETPVEGQGQSQAQSAASIFGYQPGVAVANAQREAASRAAALADRDAERNAERVAARSAQQSQNAAMMGMLQNSLQQMQAARSANVVGRTPAYTPPRSAPPSRTTPAKAPCNRNDDGIRGNCAY